MNQKDFTKFLEQEFETCRNIMSTKSSDYSTNEDKLYNFKLGGEMAGVDPIIVCDGFCLKHRVSIEQGMRELAWDGTLRPIEWWREKIRDNINYLYLLLALLTERTEEKEKRGNEKAIPRCSICGTALLNNESIRRKKCFACRADEIEDNVK
jgi:hypothetical protein